jgi:outer membrane protein TolC
VAGTPSAGSTEGRDPGDDAALAREVTVARAQEAAARRNPDLRAALERHAAARERAPQRTSLPNPRFTYLYSSMFRMRSYELMQEVPFPGKLASEGRAARAESRAARAEARERALRLRAEAAAAVAELWLARREVALIEENERLLERIVPLARARYEAGKGSQADVLRAELERSALASERAAAAATAEVAASALNALLDRPPGAPLGAVAPLAVPSTATARPERDARIERALGRRPEVAAARARAEAAEAMVSRARAEALPDLALAAAYVRDFGADADELELSAGVTLPLWWGRIGAGIDEAEAELRRARAEEDAARNRVRAEVAAALPRLVAAAERYRIASAESVPRAEQTVRAAEAAYTAGSIDFLDLLEAQRRYLGEQIGRERALAEHEVRRAELSLALGETGDARRDAAEADGAGAGWDEED